MVPREGEDGGEEASYRLSPVPFRKYKFRNISLNKSGAGLQRLEYPHRGQKRRINRSSLRQALWITCDYFGERDPAGEGSDGMRDPAQQYARLATRLFRRMGRPFTIRAAHNLARRRQNVRRNKVSWRQGADQELRRLTAALEAAGEAIVITDLEGTIQYVNPQFEIQTGYTREEVFGRNPRILKSGYHDDAFYRAMWSTLLRGEVWRSTLVNRRKDGSLYHAEQTIAPVRDASGNMINFVSVKRDITQRKRDEQAIADKNARITASARLAALGLMAGNIAHEIRNPLTVISGNAEILDKIRKREFAEHAECSAAIAGILRNTGRIERIVRGLQTLSREDHQDPFIVESLRRIVEDTLELCRPRFKPDNVELHVPAIPEDAKIECRPTQISQVLLNLLSNAVDAVKDLPERWVRIEFADVGPTVDLAVVDSGEGIPENLHGSIFQHFFTTKTPGNGTGLGLSVSRGIAENHHGHLWLDTAAGNTRFVVRLPKRQPPATAEIAANSDLAPKFG